MTVRKLIGLIFILSVFLTACGGGSNGSSGETNGGDGSSASDKITIKVANFYAEDHPQNIALNEKFKQIVEEKSDGAIKVEIYPNSQIGNEEAFSEGVRNGTIEMAVFGTVLSASEPKIGLTDLPFLFRDYDHAKAVLNSEIGDEVGESFRTLGIEPVAWSANGFRVVSSNKPLYEIDDFKGLRLRMPNAPVYIETGKALHANVVAMAISEIFTALESGTVDAQENPYATLKASGWYEVQDYVLESNHLFSSALLGANENFWNGLDEETQAIILEAAEEYADYEWQLLMDQEEEIKQYLEENGLEITVPDEQFKEAMSEAVLPVYEGFYKDNDWAEELVEKIRNN